jgi:hypothetical protein
MIKNTLLTLLIAAFFLSCANNKKLSKKQREAFYVSIEKTPCFGRCPIYKLSITDQKAFLNAYRFTENIGDLCNDIDGKWYRDLQDTCAFVNWGSFNNEYLTGYTDLPSTIIKFSVKPGDTTEVRYESDLAPLELRNIATLLHNYQLKMQANWPAALD